MQRFGSAKAKRVLVLVPGFLGGAGDFRLIARDIVKRVPACRCGHSTAARRRSRTPRGSAAGPRQGRQLLPGLQVQARAGQGRPVRRAVGAEAVAGGPAPRGAQGARRRPAQGDPRRPLAGRLDHRGLRRLGLQRQAGLQGPVRHGADRRRAARHLQQRLRHAGAGRAQGDPRGQGVRRPARAGHPRDLGHLRRGRRALRAQAAGGAQRAPGQPADPAAVQAPGARHQRGRAGVCVRQGHLAEGPGADPHQRRRAGDRRGIRAAGQDGELTPIQRFAKAFGAESPNATEWYFPRRLTLDVDAVSSLRQTKVTKLLGLRAPTRRRSTSRSTRSRPTSPRAG